MDINAASGSADHSSALRRIAEPRQLAADAQHGAGDGHAAPVARPRDAVQLGDRGHRRHHGCRVAAASSAITPWSTTGVRAGWRAGSRGAPTTRVVGAGTFLGDGPHEGGGTPARRAARGPVALHRAVPQRAAVGHGARGLQRQRRRVVVLQPRPGPLARLPLGRGRPGRDQRRAPTAVLRPGAVERAGPDPEGAPVRPHQLPRATTARTSRSTTSTSTTCRPTRYQRWLYKYPQRGVPVRRPGRHQPPTGRASRWSTSCSTPACSTTTATSTSRSSTPRPARTTCCAASRCTTAAPTTRPSTCCRRCGSATRGRSRRTPPGRRCERVAGRSPSSSRPSTTSSARCTSTPPTAPSCCSATTSPTRRGCGAPPRLAAVSRRTASPTTSCTGRRRSTPTAAAPRRPPTSASSCRPAGRRRRGCA